MKVKKTTPQAKSASTAKPARFGSSTQLHPASAKTSAHKGPTAAAKKPVTSGVAPKPKQAKSDAPKLLKQPKGKDNPQLFRINIEVGDLDAGERFYTRLLGVEGRKGAGSRVYVAAGAVTLQIVDVSATRKPHPNSESLYFLVRDLDAVYERAKALGCVSRDLVQGQPGGEIRVRPGGERSFYARDRWKNPLCFVQVGATHPG